MKKRKQKSRGLFLSCAISQGFFLISSLVLLMIFCAIASSMDDPDSVITPLSLCALYIGAVLGGLAAIKLSEGGVIAGLVSGALSSVLIFALSAFPFPTSGFNIIKSLILTLVIVPLSLVGAFIGKKRTRKPKHHRRKYS